MDQETFNEAKAHLESIGFRHDFRYNFKRGIVTLQYDEDWGEWIGWSNDGSTVWHDECLPNW